MSHSFSFNRQQHLGTQVIPFYSQLAAFLVGTTVLVIAFGQMKPHIDWIDLIGESIAFIGVLSWIRLTLQGRPSGIVTHWLGTGSACIAIGFYLDALDELVQFSNLAGDSFENVVIPIGVLLLTYALYLHRNEQLMLATRSERRETNQRDHTALDPTTSLYGAAHLRQVLASKPCVVAMIAVQAPTEYRETQFLQRRVGEFLISISPDDSFVLRYAGEQFCILLGPDQDAQIFEQTIENTLPAAMAGGIKLNFGLNIKVKAACLVRRLSPNKQPSQVLQSMSHDLKNQLHIKDGQG